MDFVHPALRLRMWEARSLRVSQALAAQDQLVLQMLHLMELVWQDSVVLGLASADHSNEQLPGRHKYERTYTTGVHSYSSANKWHSSPSALAAGIFFGFVSRETKRTRTI